MSGTRWRELLRETAGNLHRELRITFTPVPRPAKWLFVVGCYNSGTTLLVRLLDRHPGVSALPEEGQFLTDQFRSDSELGLSRMWSLREDIFRLTEADRGPDVRRLKKEWGMRADRSCPVLVEKSPPNTARTRWLQHHFDDAHFVAIVRNGYAVAEGIRRKGRPRHRRRWSIEEAARQWARSYEVLLADQEHLRRVHWIRYEDMVERPWRELRNLCSFLGLERVSEDLIGSDRSWKIHEREEPIRNLNRESLARLSADDIEAIHGVAGPMLEHFGYSASPG